MSILTYHNRLICFPATSTKQRTVSKSPVYQVYRKCLLISQYGKYGRLKEALDRVFFRDGYSMSPDYDQFCFYESSCSSLKLFSAQDTYSADGWILTPAGEIWEVYTCTDASNDDRKLKPFLLNRIDYGFGMMAQHTSVAMHNQNIIVDTFMSTDATPDDDRLDIFARALAVHWPNIYQGYYFDIYAVTKALKENKLTPEHFTSLNYLQEKGAHKLDINKGFGPPKETKPAKRVVARKKPTTKK